MTATDTSATRETAGFIHAAGGGSVYVRAYETEGVPSGPPVVLVAPDAEERTWALRALVNLARYLRERGQPVVGFDFRGQGESDGAFEETDLETRLSDLSAVAAWTAARYGTTPWLVGLRLGASLAVRLAARDPGSAAGVVAIEPVPTGESFLGEMLRKHLANQLVVHKKILLNRKELRAGIVSGEPASCNGFLVARPYVESLASLDLAGERDACRNLSVIRLVPDSAPPAADTVPVAPFWQEAATVRAFPEALFAAVAARLFGAPANLAIGPPPAEEAADGRRPVAIPAEGGRVAGTWHPPVGAGNASFLFLNPGPNDRSGPHGLYVRLGSALAAKGFGVLRIDSHRVGESDGDDAPWQGRPIPELHREINHGAMLPSATAALRWLDQRAPGRHAAFGLCGGAVNAVLAAAAEPGDGPELVLLGTPVLHLGVGVEGGALTRDALDDEVRVLGSKMLDPAYLWRLVTFQSDYGHLFRLARSRARVWLGRDGGGGRGGRGSSTPLHPQTNQVFLEAWERVAAQGVRTTFIFSEYDRLYGQFRDHFAPFVRGGGLPDAARVVVLEGANHNVTDRAAEARLLACLVDAARASAAR